jgi:hypothetical protein
METNMRFKLYHDHPGAKAGDMNGLIETMRADLVRLQEMAKAGVTCEAYGIGPPTLFTTDKAVADRYGMRFGTKSRRIGQGAVRVCAAPFLFAFALSARHNSRTDLFSGDPLWKWFTGLAWLPV